MRILLINWQDPLNPQAGGAETHLHEIYSRLAARGHVIDWLTSGWRGAPAQESLDGIRLHRTGTRYTFGIASVVGYLRRRRHLEADVTVEALNKVPVYSPLWSRSPVVLLVHHLFGTTAFREASLPLATLTWLQERPIPRVYATVPVQAISESTRDDLIDRGLQADRISVIRPGVSIDYFTPATSGCRAEIPTFLYLGRLKRYKCVDLILHALARTASSGVQARLVVAGKGDDEPRLRDLTRQLGLLERVTFAGYVTEEEKRDLFRQAWANVFVSPKEGWGITNLEAAACATPTIASDSPGLRESVVDGRTGLLVPHGDVASLAEALTRLATHPELVGQLGSQAFHYAQEFTWERAAAATESHLRRSLDPEVP